MERKHKAIQKTAVMIQKLTSQAVLCSRKNDLGVQASSIEWYTTSCWDSNIQTFNIQARKKDVFKSSHYTEPTQAVLDTADTLENCVRTLGPCLTKISIQKSLKIILPVLYSSWIQPRTVWTTLVMFVVKGPEIHLEASQTIQSLSYSTQVSVSLKVENVW